MKKNLLLILIFSLFWINNSFWYEYIDNVWWNNAKIFKIEKNWLYKVITSVSTKWENLESLVKNVWWVAWINWAYFCPKDYSVCNGENFSDFDRISNGEIYSKWKNTWVRYIFGFDKSNNPLIYQTAHTKPDSFNWIHNGLSNFPLILKDWKSFLDYYKSIIDNKMKTRGPKNFICSTKNWDIFMWYISNQTIYTMVDLLKWLGCYNALNLDSGWSLSTYDNWKYLIWPWRDIMDAFVIVKNESKTKALDDKIKLIKTKINNIIKNKAEESKEKYKLIISSKLKWYIKEDTSKSLKYLLVNIIAYLEE